MTLPSLRVDYFSGVNFFYIERVVSESWIFQTWEQSNDDIPSDEYQLILNPKASGERRYDYGTMYMAKGHGVLRNQHHHIMSTTSMSNKYQLFFLFPTYVSYKEEVVVPWSLISIIDIVLHALQMMMINSTWY